MHRLMTSITAGVCVRVRVRARFGVWHWALPPPSLEHPRDPAGPPQPWVRVRVRDRVRVRVRVGVRVRVRVRSVGE